MPEEEAQVPYWAIVLAGEGEMKVMWNDKELPCITNDLKIDPDKPYDAATINEMIKEETIEFAGNLKESPEFQFNNVFGGQMFGMTMDPVRPLKDEEVNKILGQLTHFDLAGNHFLGRITNVYQEKSKLFEGSRRTTFTIQKLKDL